mmetsp:Transcript_14263/g.38705  ORF Transcript_14263/g.38705 Transcript_14263/m.38705 type:complete len:220 (+) Transcript_14263:100-759(+)
MSHSRCDALRMAAGWLQVCRRTGSRTSGSVGVPPSASRASFAAPPASGATRATGRMGRLSLALMLTFSQPIATTGAYTCLCSACRWAGLGIWRCPTILHPICRLFTLLAETLPSRFARRVGGCLVRVVLTFTSRPVASAWARHAMRAQGAGKIWRGMNAGLLSKSFARCSVLAAMAMRSGNEGRACGDAIQTLKRLRSQLDERPATRCKRCIALSLLVG